MRGYRHGRLLEGVYFAEHGSNYGQGTVSLVILERPQEIDTLIVPIRGGLISGVAFVVKAINPAIRVLAAEPTGADDAFQLKTNGRITKLFEVNTIADGLRAFLGDLTRPIICDLVNGIIVDDDKEIIRAMRLCYEILKIAVELLAWRLFFLIVSEKIQGVNAVVLLEL